MKVLVITNLFPNPFEPTRGMYNKQQILALSKVCDLKVVSAIAWSNSLIARLKSRKTTKFPNKALVDNIEVFYQEYFMTPKIFRSLYGYFFFLSLRRLIGKIRCEFKFDLIYSPWAYPDGFGSYLLAKKMGVPVIIGVLGSDINIYTNFFLLRKLIVSSLCKSTGIVAVSSALKDKLVSLGVPEKKICVITNGVDNNLFKLLNKKDARTKLSLPEEIRIILYIGNLTPVKGVSFLIKAFKTYSITDPSCYLYIVGDGNLRNKLENLAKALEIEKKVIFFGKALHNDIPFWLNASDLFCLPSLQEGCPNVILEALACGVPIVASNVGGIPELITSTRMGYLIEPGNVRELSEILQVAIKEHNGVHIIRMESEIISWDRNAEELYSFFKKVTSSKNEEDT